MAVQDKGYVKDRQGWWRGLRHDEGEEAVPEALDKEPEEVE